MWTGWNIFLSLYCSTETEAILVGLEEVAGVVAIADLASIITNKKAISTIDEAMGVKPCMVSG